jgi:hypothetical protein
VPNPNLKYILIFDSSEGYGWTETHYKPAAVPTPPLDQALNLYFLSVGAARAALLGENCSIVGARVSYRVTKGIASYGLRQKIAGTPQQGSSAPALSLAVNFKNTDFTKTSITHLRGFWDQVEFDETYRPDLAPGWDDRFIAWKQALITGGWGWLSKDPALSAKGIVPTYAVGADQRVTFTLVGDPMPDATLNTNVEVGFSGFNNRHSILNRPLLVNVVDATHLKTVNPIAAGPQTSPGKYNYRGTSFIGYANTSSISLGERRMGKPLNRLPGRQKAQVLS